MRPRLSCTSIRPQTHLARLALAATIAAAAASMAQAQGDGPRAYQLVPDGTDLLAVWALNLQGNSTGEPGQVFIGGEGDVNIAALQYTHTVDIGGQQTGLFIVVPAGGVNADFSFSFGSATGSSTGLGDVNLGAVFGLTGSPSLSRADYAAYQPGFSNGVLVKFGLPTGEYDASKVINLGSNRYWAQLGLPFGYALGKSYLDPRLTTFEVLPSVVVYGDNDDPFGPATTSGQAPFLMLEAHLTHNFNRAIWASIDMLYNYGGETSTDGVGNNDIQRSFGMGVTGFMALSQTSGLKVSYGQTISANASGADGSMIRAIWVTTF